MSPPTTSWIKEKEILMVLMKADVVLVINIFSQHENLASLLRFTLSLDFGITKTWTGAWGLISRKARTFSSSYTIEEGVSFEMILSNLTKIKIYKVIWNIHLQYQIGVNKYKKIKQNSKSQFYWYTKYIIITEPNNDISWHVTICHIRW